jgi:hypothetical protein
MYADYAIFRLLHEDWVADATATRRTRRRPTGRTTRVARSARR